MPPNSFLRNDKNEEKIEEEPERDKKDKAEEDNLEGKEEELQDDPLTCTPSNSQTVNS